MTYSCSRCYDTGNVSSPPQWSESGKAVFSVDTPCDCPSGAEWSARVFANFPAADDPNWIKPDDNGIVSIVFDHSQLDK